jgi:Ca2+/Na+ antiporter
LALTFLAVTGPKHDLWLVKTVGILIAVIGGVLLTASFQKGRNYPIITLANSSAFSLAMVDVFFYLSGTIPAIYLLDAIAEFVLIVLWLVVLYRKKENLQSLERL